MEFLELVAEHLCSRYGNNFSRVVLVFPNKRAGLFFDDILLTRSERSGDISTVWAPAYMTISQLFDGLASLRPVQEIKAVCILYQIYRKYMGERITDARGKNYEMTLDYFYGWGRQLLSDFSDIDCGLCDTTKLFSNLEAAKILERLGDEQYQSLSPLISLLKGRTNDGPQRLKDEFLHLWGSLAAIYAEFNQRLANDGEAYEGARQRMVIEGLRSGEIQLPGTYDTYVFVGFNLLLATERALFQFLHKEGRAEFYWDYDEMYVSDNAPMSFDGSMAANLRNFPNALQDPTLFRNFAIHDTLHYVAAQSSNAGTRYAAQWLSRLKQQGVEEKDMAVVLCDESMVEPMIHCIPEAIRCVNITKGFPMTHTSAYHFVQEKLKAWGSGDNVASLLHELMDSLRGEAMEVRNLTLEGGHAEKEWLRILKTESCFEAYTLLSSMATLVDEGLLSVSPSVLSRLIRQILSNVTIPFHGEPLGGVQIMGMLETRNLDFPHLLMLSVGEGIVPSRSTDRSFVPFDLRKNFGIMTADERSRVFAYNFYRLLARSHDVTLVYNASTDGEKSSGEMSRFMLQILLQTNIPIDNYTLNESIGKGAESAAMACPEGGLESKLSLSPSSIIEYTKCPLKYWFNHVAKIRKPEKVEDILSLNSFGTVFHAAAENLLKTYLMGKELKSSMLKKIAENRIAIKECVAAAMREQIRLEHPETEMLEKVNRHEFEAGIIEAYIIKLLETDARLCEQYGLVYEAVEVKGKATIDNVTMLEGKIDRVDKMGGNLRIVDYKTGKYDENKVTAGSMDSVFSADKGYVFQTLCYSLMYQEQNQVAPLPALYYLSQLGSDDWKPYIEFQKELADMDPSDRLSVFREALKTYITETMRKKPFERNDHNCNQCPYTLLCGVKTPS